LKNEVMLGKTSDGTSWENAGDANTADFTVMWWRYTLSGALLL